jgi:molybdopterin-binding protein
LRNRLEGKVKRDGPSRRGDHEKEAAMALSARNQLPGTVKSVVRGTVLAEVVLDVAGHQVVSVITRHAVENLDIKAGDQVKAVIKSTEVMIEK